MEKTILKRKLIIFFMVIVPLALSAQTPSIIQNIRIPLWAELDAYPAMVAEEDSGGSEATDTEAADVEAVAGPEDAEAAKEPGQ